VSQKIKVAIFDLTDCEGCEVQFLALKEKLLDLFESVEINNWRLMKDNNNFRQFDISFIEGFVSNISDINLIKKIRAKSKMVIALGNCAINGNFFNEFNDKKRVEISKKIYNASYKIKATTCQPLKNFIKVDQKIMGCPIGDDEIYKFFHELDKIIKNIKKIPASSEKENNNKITQNYIAKIEGHGKLNINFRQNKLNLEIDEGERLLEELLIGKSYTLAPYMTSRICGVCPTAHNLTAIKAVENAFSIKIPAQVTSLRKILLNTQIIQSHLLHLFFLVLPDYYNTSSAMEIIKKYPAEFHIALNIKRLCDKILTIIAGRAVHPTNTCVGGFNKYPTQDELSQIRDTLYDSIDEVEDLVKIFTQITFYNLSCPTNYLGAAQNNNNYDFYSCKKIISSDGKFSSSKFKNKVKEFVSFSSTAKYALLNDKSFMVGALSRINCSGKYLKGKAKEYYIAYKDKLTSNNPFYNNLAQAIEMLQAYQDSLDIISDLIKNCKTPKPISIKVKAGIGFALVEAPRGLLFHYYKINKKGIITKADIITPTVQNIANMERDCQKLLELTEKLPDTSRQELIEQLIRAYDPCMTCSVH